MIDLHCHLLAGIDDGPSSADDAAALAGALLEAGVTRVVATPHVSPAHPNTAAGIQAAWLAVVTELGRRHVPLEVLRGAELDLVHAAALSYEELGGLTLGVSGALLVECPFVPLAPQFETVVERFQQQGFRVVLAHPERSAVFQRDPDLLRRLVSRGALASLTGASLAGKFGRTARRYSCWALDEGLAHDVATDAHDVVNRSPVLRGAVIEAGYEWALDWLTREVPDAVLSGRELPPRPARPVGEGRWLRRLVHGTG